ncbi:RNA-guided endonuclease InsQ/TnpB family protein [Halospeciosus flavus]|uniref:RNA-guided endonuclease InsQ/TnpB family protein n=1 Tax=Halospeciosus flavus TaxID=3032283 RepID=A0ABD5Z6J5_9EURY|nr:transposase [Halospeciosus flavus]
MWYSHRYRAYPDTETATAAEHHIDIHRQLYNHVRWDYERAPSEDKPTRYQQHRSLTDWKRDWPTFAELNAKAGQRTVSRFHQNLSLLADLKSEGYSVGRLKWKSPSNFRSVTYHQSGFNLDKKRGPNGYAHVRFAKIGWIPIRYHRDLPENSSVKEVVLKRERTGEWFVTFGIEVDDATLPEKPDVETLDSGNSVGVDLGILNYIYTSDGFAVTSLDLDSEHERLQKAGRTLSRREQGSNNWEKQRKRVARLRRDIRRKVLDFQHKLTTWLVREYDAVFVENLEVRKLLQSSHNSRNKQDAAWGRFIQLLEYKSKLYGCHVKRVKPAGTTKECAKCGVNSEKPLWVREHSCPACGFECDRDANAAYNVLSRGLHKLGQGLAEETPVETVLPTSADGNDSTTVDAKHVVETGSVCPAGSR